MKEINLLELQFDNKVRLKEVPKFRGALLTLIDKENPLFHNHLVDTRLRYSYPLVQYKSIDGNAAIVAIGEASQQLEEVMYHFNQEVSIGRRRVVLQIGKTKPQIFAIKELKEPAQYKITNWLPLNEQNFNRYKELDSLAEKAIFLERVMIGNIISFAKGVKYDVHFNIELTITNIEKESSKRHKGVSFYSLDLSFKTNIALPPSIGLGRGSSHGFGLLEQY